MKTCYVGCCQNLFNPFSSNAASMQSKFLSSLLALGAKPFLKAMLEHIFVK